MTPRSGANRSEGDSAGVRIADLRNPAAILSDPTTQGILDFSRPIVLITVGILHFLEQRDQPEEVLATLLGALPSGSYLVASHFTTEHDPASVGAGESTFRSAGLRGQLRDSSDFARLALSGLDLVPPGWNLCRSGGQKAPGHVRRRPR